MSKGFGMLKNLNDLKMFNCVKLESLPESESQLTSHFLISNFGNMMSEGFGDLNSLQQLILAYSGIEALPESKTCSCIFYFLISNFGNRMSEGFGQLASIQRLDLGHSPAGRNLPMQLKDKLVAQGCELLV